MRKVEHRLRLDLLRGGNQGYIRVKRGEKGARRLSIALYMHSVPYMADPGTTVTFRAIKPDNKKLFNSATITDNVVTVGLTTQTVAALGTVKCELTIYGTNNEVLYSPQFDIIVEDYLYSDTAIESTDEYTDLTEAISKVNNIVSTEAARVAAENQRVANETARGNAETERETAETARAEAETARATAETERAAAENARKTAMEKWENATATSKTGSPAGVQLSDVNGHKNFEFTIPSGSGGDVPPAVTADDIKSALGYTPADEADIPTVPTALKNPQSLTFTGAATGSYDGSEAKTVNIPTALKNPNALTITVDGTAKTYDGSAAQSITIPPVVNTAVSLPASGTALTDNTIYSVMGTVNTYAFEPPASNGWAHGTFITGSSPSISFTGRIIGKLPTFAATKIYEFDVYKGAWIVQEVIAQ